MLVTFWYSAMEMQLTETGVSDLEEEARWFTILTDSYHLGKKMELRKAEKALDNEIGWMVDSSQWEESLAVPLEIEESENTRVVGKWEVWCQVKSWPCHLLIPWP